LLPPERAKRIQEIVGVFLYYARAVDPTMTYILSLLGSVQSKPTLQVEVLAQRFLNYAATWPNASIKYFKSDMKLYIQSDASYLGDSKSRSRAGGMQHLSSHTLSNNPPVNGTILVRSNMIDVVVASAAEAEYAGMFLNAQDALPVICTLEDLGYPQHDTVIQGDNLCSIGIANNSVKQKKSRSMDMRFHWLRDRVKQGQFKIIWRKGNDNLADYFTKKHPNHHFRAMRKFFVEDGEAPHLRDNARRRHRLNRMKKKINK